MLQFEEVKQALVDLEPELRELADALGLEKTKEEIEKLEQQAAAPGFWDDLENTQKVLQRTSSLKAKVENYNKLCGHYDDAMALAEMGDEAEDLSILPEAQEELENFKSQLEAMRLTTLLTGEYDSKNAILTFHAGAAERKPRTGQKCCTGCTTAGASATASR